jgi:hypothetical protein
MHGSRTVVAVVAILFSTAATIVAMASRPATAAEKEPIESCDWSCYGRYESGGWQVYETRNFRLHFVGREPQLAAMAKTCEQTRASLRRIWLAADNSASKPRSRVGLVSAESDEPWSPKCDVYLYSDPKHYARCAGTPAETRGTSNLQIGQGKVWTRRIHMRIDQAGYLEDVLPHELTHVVLADRFNTRVIPRWADEGIAMLTEPPQRREEWLQTIAKARQNGSLFSLRELLTAKKYPTNQARATLFFAQSVAFVDYIVSERSESELIRLIETGETSSYDRAVRELFSVHGLAALEPHWTAWLADRTRSSGTVASESTAAPTLTLTSKDEQRPGG